ncbi:MAG: hypothetical protein SGJ20_20745 [Planctomycetota bacterium]|nr:hypothetical protein [Planctomycetota bacterium]
MPRSSTLWTEIRRQVSSNAGNAVRLLLLLLLVLALQTSAFASVKTQAAREATEYVMKQFSKETIEGGAEKFAAKLEVLATRNGDEALLAVKKVGPRAVDIIETAGVNGPQAAKLLSKYGDEALVVSRQPESLALISKYGDDAAEAMIKHPGIADDVVAAYGKEGASAMARLNKENGLELARLMKSGELAQIGRGANLLAVVTKYGDAGMQFIWKHKKALAVTATLTAFLANPQPFIDGTRDLGQTAIESVGNVATQVPKSIAENTDWTPVMLAIVAVVSVYVLSRALLPRLREKLTRQKVK